jgi:hypothetical protein
MSQKLKLINMQHIAARLGIRYVSKNEFARRLPVLNSCLKKGALIRYLRKF